MPCVSSGELISATLLADVTHPGLQEDLVSNWEPAHSLVEDAISGAKIAPYVPALAVACLPLCLWWGDGPVPPPATSFFSLSLAIPQFGLLSQVSSLRWSSGHSGPVLTLSTDYAACTSLSSLSSLVGTASVWATSPLGVVVRCVVCGFFVFSFLPFMLPSEIQNSPHTHR